jgi:hypothetical protein
MKPPPEPTIVPNAPTAKPISASRTAVVGEKLSGDHDREAFREAIPTIRAGWSRCGLEPHPMLEHPMRVQQPTRGGRSSGTLARSRNSSANARKLSMSPTFETRPSEARTAPPEGKPIALR